ncbi:MAG: hypothetical protein ACFCU1_01085 [Sumerlaeia bacterium]
MISPGTNSTESGQRLKTGILFTLGNRGGIFTKIGVVHDDDTTASGTHSTPQKQRRFLPFQRLYNKTQPLVRAVAAHQKGKLERAQQLLWHITHPDERAFLAIVEYQSKQPLNSIKLLEEALEEKKQLGKYFFNYEIPVSIGIQLGESINKTFGPEYKSFMMIHAELCLEVGSPHRAIPYLKSYLHANPLDLDVRLYTARYMMDFTYSTKDNARYVVGITDQVTRSENHDGELFLYRAKALMQLKLYIGAQEALEKVIDQHFMPSDSLMKEGFYQLYQLHELQGKQRDALKNLKLLYERDRGYRDVAERMSAVGA